jgi:glycosyltransferase involved in cell wall biosynthesis
VNQHENKARPLIHIAHEWLTEWGGSEDVVRAMLECLPEATLSATINFLSTENRARFKTADIQTTFLQRMPFVEKRFWNYLPLTPLAVESLDLSDADIIISSSHAFAKGVLTTAEQLHISYIHSPMRYAWDLHFQYLRDYGLDTGIKGHLARWMFHRLRLWDRQTANNVDLFLANSDHVRQRIWRTYRRPARVLYPPVKVEKFGLQREKDDYYVSVSRLVSYKRMDLIVEAFRAMPGRKLVVIGDGPQMRSLQAHCPPNVTLMGWQPDEVVREYLANARAFVFAAHEDFGISPVEAQACGTPVVAYGAGGSVETVRDVRQLPEPTGLLFPQQTAASLMEAVEEFERLSGRISPDACRQWAEGFSEARFKREFSALVEEAWVCWKNDPQTLEQKMLGSGP